MYPRGKSVKESACAGVSWLDDILEEEKTNTSLWITDLHPDTNYSTLLGAIRQAGNIKSSYIDRPMGISSACVARVVFFTTAGAEHVYNSARAGTFTVLGTCPKVHWSLAWTPEDPNPPDRTRVLRIKGPSHIVNQSFLEEF